MNPKETSQQTADRQISNTVSFTSSPSITPEQLEPVPALRLKNQVPSTTATGILADVNALTTGDATRAKERDAANREMRIAEMRSSGADTSKALRDIMGQLATQSDRTIKLEEEAGIAEKQSQLDEIDSRIASIEQATRNRLQRLKETSAGMTQGAYEDEIRRIEREGAQEAADVGIVRSALQNKLATAQSLVDRKVALETEGLKARFDAIKFFYDENKEELTKEEQRKFEQLTKDADREYTETRDRMKTLEQTKLEMLQSAASQGASNAVLQSIMSSKTAEEAVANAGQFAGDILDRTYKLAQINKLTSEVQASSNPEYLGYAAQYASTGQIPTGLPKGAFEQVAQIAKELPKSTGSLVDINTNVKSGKLNETQLGGIQALYDITEKVEQLKLLNEERAEGLIAAGVGKVFGSEKQQRYLDLRGEIVDLLARARTGAALTVQEEDFYSSQLPGRVGEVAGLFGVDTGSRIDNFANKITSSLENKLKLNNLAIHGYSKVKLDGQEFRVGDVIENGDGQKGRINPDGTITIIQ